MRFCQNKFGTTPYFKIVETNGPPHNRTFKINCYIQDLTYKYGIGKSKKEAENNAAFEALKYYNINVNEYNANI